MYTKVRVINISGHYFKSENSGSTQNPPPKPGKLPWEENLETPAHHPTHRDNFSEFPEAQSISLGPSQQCSVQGIYDLTQYLAIR